MSDDFRIVIESDGPVYWPFWPFRLPVRFQLHRGFRLRIFQRDQTGMHPDPVKLEGFIASDGEITLTVDFNGASRLKRRTYRRGGTP